MKVESTSFSGAEAIEITTDAVRLVVVTAYGPRIAFFGEKEGANLLYWAPGKHLRNQWDLRGGHRVWVATPQADESEDTYFPDNEPCTCRILEDGVEVLGAENPVNRTRRGLRIRVLGEREIEVDNLVMNTGALLYSGSVWALTCTAPVPGAEYVVPVGDGSSWDTFPMVFFREWAGQGQGRFDDSQIQVEADLVRVRPAGKENKRMLLSHEGIIAMHDPVHRVAFAKRIAYDSAKRYPLNTNIAFYIGDGNFMVEMETMGFEATLKPGTTLHHPETWVLRNAPKPLDNAGNVRALFTS